MDENGLENIPGYWIAIEIFHLRLFSRAVKKIAAVPSTVFTAVKYFTFIILQ